MPTATLKGTPSEATGGHGVGPAAPGEPEAKRPRLPSRAVESQPSSMLPAPQFLASETGPTRLPPSTAWALARQGRASLRRVRPKASPESTALVPPRARGRPAGASRMAHLKSPPPPPRSARDGAGRVLGRVWEPGRVEGGRPAGYLGGAHAGPAGYPMAGSSVCPGERV